MKRRADYLAWAREAYPDPTGMDEIEAMFAFLVDAADVYVSLLEAIMPTDQPNSPFLGGLMPIDAAIAGLADNLVFRQESGARLGELG